MPVQTHAYGWQVPLPFLNFLDPQNYTFTVNAVVIISNSWLFPNPDGSNPRISFLLSNKFKYFFSFSFISETFGAK